MVGGAVLGPGPHCHKLPSTRLTQVGGRAVAQQLLAHRALRAVAADEQRRRHAQRAAAGRLKFCHHAPLRLSVPAKAVAREQHPRRQRLGQLPLQHVPGQGDELAAGGDGRRQAAAVARVHQLAVGAEAAGALVV